MRLRDLVVLLDDSARCEANLEMAAMLARTHDAHLTGLCLLELLIPIAPGYALAAYPDVFALQPVADLRDRARATAEKIEARFRETLRRDGLSGDWILGRGFPAEDAVQCARRADLVVIGQRNPDEQARHPVANDLLEDVLMGAGRPVLVVPYVGTYEVIGKSVLIGWKDSTQATRAAHDAMPLIDKSGKVTVLTVQRGRRDDEMLPGADMATHLARHGLTVSAARTVNDGSISDADAMLSYASDLGADLLVMGAYGHSRRREILLGGVTREIVDHMTLPVLMSH
jgi:nucleotide-binding universal stress UspA family protein